MGHSARVMDKGGAQDGCMDTELTYAECLDLLRSARVGRMAFCTPSGPHIVPVNFVVVDDSIVVRTTPYSALGTYGWTSRLAFEVDETDAATRQGWSVVATGRGEMVRDRDEIEFLHAFHDPQPWASGARILYLRLPWTGLSGRRVGAATSTARTRGSAI